jgi:hypothetical protein
VTEAVTRFFRIIISAFSTAYHKALDEDGYNQLTLGFQATYGQKRLDLSKATFEDQLTALGFTGVTAECSAIKMALI